MCLVNAVDSHFSEIVGWVKNAEELLHWAGPSVRFPLSVSHLRHDLTSSNWPSFVLLGSGGELLAYGQYYLRERRGHLCRLIVSPQYRGRGVVINLVQSISKEATNELGVDSYSLFVYRDNLSAIGAYQKMGFVVQSNAGDQPIDDCLFMVRD